MSLTPQTRTATTMTPMTRAGQGWKYDQADITYDATTDSAGRQVLYDTVGFSETVTPLSKNSVTLAGLTKNAA